MLTRASTKIWSSFPVSSLLRQDVPLGLVQRRLVLHRPLEEVRQTALPRTRQRRKDDPSLHAQGRPDGPACPHPSPQVWPRICCIPWKLNIKFLLGVCWPNIRHHEFTQSYLNQCQGHCLQIAWLETTCCCWLGQRSLARGVIEPICLSTQRLTWPVKNYLLELYQIAGFFIELSFGAWLFFVLLLLNLFIDLIMVY